MYPDRFEFSVCGKHNESSQTAKYSSAVRKVERKVSPADFHLCPYFRSCVRCVAFGTAACFSIHPLNVSCVKRNIIFTESLFIEAQQSSSVFAKCFAM